VQNDVDLRLHETGGDDVYIRDTLERRSDLIGIAINDESRFGICEIVGPRRTTLLRILLVESQHRHDGTTWSNER
jgi:hypothetical protein